MLIEGECSAVTVVDPTLLAAQSPFRRRQPATPGGNGSGGNGRSSGNGLSPGNGRPTPSSLRGGTGRANGSGGTSGGGTSGGGSIGVDWDPGLLRRASGQAVDGFAAVGAFVRRAAAGRRVMDDANWNGSASSDGGGGRGPPLTPEEEAQVELYSGMLKAGVPNQAVRDKMSAVGLAAKLIEAVCGGAPASSRLLGRRRVSIMEPPKSAQVKDGLAPQTSWHVGGESIWQR